MMLKDILETSLCVFTGSCPLILIPTLLALDIGSEKGPILAITFLMIYYLVIIVLFMQEARKWEQYRRHRK